MLSRSIDRIETRSIDFAGQSESAETAETEPGTQTVFCFFFFLISERKTETKQQLQETKIYLN
jgi:hypothetical protein